MEFEYDLSKSTSNKVKHGIDFEEAQALWNGPVAIAPLGSGHGRGATGCVRNDRRQALDGYRDHARRCREAHICAKVEGKGGGVL